jgi:hypothetical protein
MKPLTSNERAQLHFRPTNTSTVKINLTRLSLEARADPEKLDRLIALIGAGARSEA